MSYLSDTEEPPAKRAKISSTDEKPEFFIVVNDSDSPDEVIENINKLYAQELSKGQMKTGTKISKTTETPDPDYADEDAQAPPTLQYDDIYVKVESNKVVDYNYHGDFSERSYSPLPEGSTNSLLIGKTITYGEGGRKTYKKKGKKTYKKKGKKTYKKKGKKTYKKKSRKHNKKRKTRKL